MRAVRLPESDVKNLLSRLRDWWWWLWTGDQSEAATRRRIEHEAARFGGTVTWDTPAERRDQRSGLPPSAAHDSIRTR
jgi:hypothetical protein